LQTVAIIAIAVLVVSSVLVIRFVQKVATKIVLLAVLAGLALLAWNARVELSQCAQTCDCRIYGQDVHVPKVGCDRSLTG
jgi:hypothetical protein